MVNLFLSLLCVRHRHTDRQLTKEIHVQILSIGIVQALSGCALVLHSLFSSIGVDRWHNENPCVIDQLEHEQQQKRNSYRRY